MRYLIKNNNIVILLFLICLNLLGCATVGKESPHVHVVDLQIQEVKAFETVLKMDLRVINPNDMEVKIKGMDCDLEINGKPFATGVSDQETTIPAFGTTIVPVIVYSSVFDVIRGVVGLQGKDKIEYKLKGHLHLEGDVLVPSSVRFESGGELSLKDINLIDR